MNKNRSTLRIWITRRNRCIRKQDYLLTWFRPTQAVSTGKSPWRIRRHDNVILCATRSYSPRSFNDFSFQGNYSEARNFHVSKLNAQFRIAIDEIRAANSWSESALASPSLDDAAPSLGRARSPLRAAGSSSGAHGSARPACCAERFFLTARKIPRLVAQLPR
jgi:hypothetical protein